MAEWEIAQIRERYGVFYKESLYQAIQNGEVAGHPAWEDYIVWKNKEAHIAPGGFSGEIANRGNMESPRINDSRTHGGRQPHAPHIRQHRAKATARTATNP